jgi:hypothetical protein
MSIVSVCARYARLTCYLATRENRFAFILTYFLKRFDHGTTYGGRVAQIPIILRPIFRNVA